MKIIKEAIGLLSGRPKRAPVCDRCKKALPLKREDGRSDALGLCEKCCDAICAILDKIIKGELKPK